MFNEVQKYINMVPETYVSIDCKYNRALRSSLCAKGKPIFSNTLFWSFLQSGKQWGTMIKEDLIRWLNIVHEYARESLVEY